MPVKPCWGKALFFFGLPDSLVFRNNYVYRCRITNIPGHPVFFGNSELTTLQILFSGKSILLGKFVISGIWKILIFTGQFSASWVVPEKFSLFRQIGYSDYRKSLINDWPINSCPNFKKARGLPENFRFFVESHFSWFWRLTALTGVSRVFLGNFMIILGHPVFCIISFYDKPYFMRNPQKILYIFLKTRFFRNIFAKILFSIFQQIEVFWKIPWNYIILK